MIRNRLILAALALLAAWLTWDFMERALMYDPMSEMADSSVESVAQEAQADQYEAAWSPIIKSKDIFSKDRGQAIAMPSLPVLQQSMQQPKVVDLKAPNITLSGIISDNFGDMVAYISINDGKGIGVRKGDMIGGIKITGITPTTVDLSWQGRTYTLKLKTESLFKR